MDLAELSQRAPDPIFVTTARITSRRFIVNADGIPSMVPRRSYTVYGAVFDLDVPALTCLSLRLGFPSMVERYGGFVRDPNGTLMVVEFHAARNHRVGRASPDCISAIVASAQHYGFPESYVEELCEWDVDAQS
jgi:hypothetical protein